MKLIPIILIITILFLPASTLLFLRKEVGINQAEEGQIIFFSGDKDFMFEFTSPKNNLNSAVLKLKNVSLRNSKPVFFKLSENQNIIREIQINGSNIGDGELVRFVFPTITDSKNKIYMVAINSPTSEEKDAIGVYTDNQNNPVLITYHNPEDRFQLIYDIYMGFFIKVSRDPFFIALWAVMLGSSILLLTKIDNKKI